VHLDWGGSRRRGPLDRVPGLPQLLPGAEDPVHHGAQGELKHIGDLDILEVLKVIEDQDFSVHRRHPLQGGAHPIGLGHAVQLVQR